MSVLEFIIIREQQIFEEGKGINPIEIKIEDNRIRNVFDRYKNNKVRFKPTGLLMASNVLNDTKKIFLQTTGLKSARYALLNADYKQIIGIISLDQVKNWDTLEQTSKWIDIIFQDQTDNKNTTHPSFSFVSSNKDNLLRVRKNFLSSNLL